MFVEQFSQALGDIAMAIGLRDNGNDIALEAEDLLTEPITWYMNHPNWPSGLTGEQTPLEWSISLAADGTPSMRYNVDATDHRQGLGGNWIRYMSYAKRAMGGVNGFPQNVWKLLVQFLDGSPALYRSRVIHGVGYGPAEAKRSSIYFSTRWLTFPHFEGRCPKLAGTVNQTLRQYHCPQPSYFDMIGFDFGNQPEYSRTKLYQWLGGDVFSSSFTNTVGHHPDTLAAGKVFEHFQSAVPINRLADSLLLQWSTKQSDELCGQKIMFPCPRWGWANPQGFRTLLAYLADQFGADLAPLYTALAVLSEYKIQLKPILLAVGPGDSCAGLSFYFSPVCEESDSIATAAKAPARSAKRFATDETTSASNSWVLPQLDILETMITGAIEYLLAAKTTDGCWTDFSLPEGASPSWVTAYVTSILAMNPATHEDLCSAQQRLSDWFRPGHGWGQNSKTQADADSTAISLLALERLGKRLPDGAFDALFEYRLASGGYCAYSDKHIDYEQGNGAPEVTAAVLLAQLEAKSVIHKTLYDTVANLTSQQRQEGGWNSFWWKDDLFAICRIVRALSAYQESIGQQGTTNDQANSALLAAQNALARARPSISAQAIPDEPFLLGLWLSSWVAAKGSPFYISIPRIVRHLYSQQESDGRWLATPTRRITVTKLFRPWARSDAGDLYIDGSCLVTTSTVLDGLWSLYNLLKCQRQTVTSFCETTRGA